MLSYSPTALQATFLWTCVVKIEITVRKHNHSWHTHKVCSDWLLKNEVSPMAVSLVCIFIFICQIMQWDIYRLLPQSYLGLRHNNVLSQQESQGIIQPVYMSSSYVINTSVIGYFKELRVVGGLSEKCFLSVYVFFSHTSAMGQGMAILVSKTTTGWLPKGYIFFDDPNFSSSTILRLTVFILSAMSHYWTDYYDFIFFHTLSTCQRYHQVKISI